MGGPSGLRRIVAPAFVLGAMLLVVPVAGAVPLPPTNNALPGSSFQGADGNQAPAPPLVDWATLQATGRVEHSPDPNAQDNAFANGSKEDEPGGWDLVNEPGGVSPAKDNILDAWSSVDAVGANTFLYLAFARAAGNGTSFLTFELNRDSRRWDNGRARIPCRRDGDVLITFEPHGHDVTVSIRTWHTATTDPMTGCARTGSLSDNASVTANVDVQGAANAAAIANSLPGSSGATIPEAEFGESAINLGKVLTSALGTSCGAYTSFWMHSRSSDSENSSMQDYVAPHAIDARRCAAAGTKWLDNNANGVRDAGDGPLSGFRIYADLNGNARYDNGEPFAITDDNGDYVIDDIKASGTYTLREEPTSAVALDGPWTCSHPSPCAWTIDATAQPYAKDRDFGNWRPARVTLIKKLDPPDDQGRFDLSFGPYTLHNAGNGDTQTFSVKPGTYAVSETPVGGTDAADYDSSIACHPVARLVTLLRGATRTTQTVAGGERVECTFVNVRRGSPSVTIDKIAPAAALHGDTLKYTLAVTNTGNVSFAARDVDVEDDQCDAPPKLSQKLSGTGAPDASPGSLDPQDTWIYTCERKTKPIDNPEDCRPSTATNTASVAVPGGGDTDTEETELICPPPRRPGIAIQKVGPSTAVAGTPLTYVFYVTNTGEVPFAEADVTVSDPACDAPPQRVARFLRSGNPDTSSPAVLDPGDVWIYVCTNTTPAPGPDCQPSVVTNTGTVVATSRRPTVDDSDSFETPLTCPAVPPTPPEPPAPPAPQPQPEPPAPTPQETQNLVPPTAGVAGQSALSPIRGCLRRGSRVVILGSRIASITVTVGGKRVGGLRVQALQRRAIIQLVGTFEPGRYRATATIRFERGAATPTVRLTRAVRICAAAAAAPKFTG